MSGNRLKSLVKSLLDNGKIFEALFVYNRSYSHNFLKAEFLEIFVDEIAKKARENVKDCNHFNLKSFICFKCHDFITDPVTLKCGHTFSKKCLLLEARNDYLSCPKCSQRYSVLYLSQLGNNVVILSLMEKLSEKYLNHKVLATTESSVLKIYEAKRIDSQEKETLAEADHPAFYVFAMTAIGYFKKGNFLASLGNLKEAFKAYLTSLTLDANAYYAKMSAIEILRRLIQTRPRNHDCNLRSSKSSDSLHLPEDDSSSSDEEETEIEDPYDLGGLYSMFDHFFDSIKTIRDEVNIVSRIDVSFLDKRELECPLCMRILWEPITTTCGHTFCRVCLNRCLDHKPSCPLCKSSLTAFLAERVQNTTEFLEFAIKNLFPSDYSERLALFKEEMEQLSNAGKDPNHEIPLFVCTVALPTVPCPLHVFEPRYRFMIRQCMESGSKQFGMCGVVNDEIAEYGTMLEIQDVQYFPDGRSIVNTVGSKRFRILRKGERDGYHTAAVEFLEDQPLNNSDLVGIEEKHDRTYNISKFWFMHLPIDTRHQILEHFGPMPPLESDYTSSRDGPSWLWWMLAILPIETRLKVLLVSLTSFPRRIEFLYRILLHFQSSITS